MFGSAHILLPFLADTHFSDRFDMNTFEPLDRASGFYASVIDGVFSITADRD